MTVNVRYTLVSSLDMLWNVTWAPPNPRAREISVIADVMKSLVMSIGSAVTAIVRATFWFPERESRITPDDKVLVPERVKPLLLAETMLPLALEAQNPNWKLLVPTQDGHLPVIVVALCTDPSRLQIDVITTVLGMVKVTEPEEGHLVERVAQKPVSHWLSTL